MRFFCEALAGHGVTWFVKLTVSAGKRHFPERVTKQQPLRKEGFSLRSSRECYREFASQVRASFPLYVRDRRQVDAEPAGLAVKQQPDAGPLTGLRKPPGLLEAQLDQQQQTHLMEPDPQLVMEVATRKGC